MRILHSFSNFSGRKKTFYQFSIRGKEGEDEGKDRIEKCTEGVKKLQKCPLICNDNFYSKYVIYIIIHDNFSGRRRFFFLIFDWKK